MTEERRRYFRIDDSMGVSYRHLGTEEAKAFVQQAREQGSNFDYAANFDNRIETLLDSCKIQAPIAAELIGLMNRKLNFIIQQMDVDSSLMQHIAYTMKQVNVSACGMAFINEELLQRGQQLQLDILLHPSELHVCVMAEVIACAATEAEKEDGEAYFVRLNFLEISTSDQELLIQHIVKRQGAQLKQLRRMREVE